VIIVNDGSDIHLSPSFLNSYPFKIEYYLNDHKGVSATRNACLDYATADYVMFCDADDMFYNACGLYIIFKEIQLGDFETLTSVFIEECRFPEQELPIYINHELDSVFVHGKVHNREFLIKNKIRWNETLTIHEDSYFNCLC
jgi:glycosyltransferase involved in cell wall biosynthesis